MKKTSIIILSIYLLSGCSNAKETLGLGRNSPDEFAVMKRAPLEIPSNLRTLPVPQKGVARPQEDTTDKIAKKALFGEEKTQETPSHDGQAEQALLQKVGAENSPADIRTLIDKEAKEFADSEQPVIDKLLKRKKTVPGSILDAREELENLKKKNIPTPNVPPVPAK